MGGPLKLKADVIPHLFKCQSDMKWVFDNPIQSVVEKRRKEYVTAALI